MYPWMLPTQGGSFAWISLTDLMHLSALSLVKLTPGNVKFSNKPLFQTSKFHDLLTPVNCRLELDESFLEQFYSSENDFYPVIKAGRGHHIARHLNDCPVTALESCSASPPGAVARAHAYDQCTASYHTQFSLA